MRINTLNIAISVLISALVAYGFWCIGGGLAKYLAVGSFLYLSGTLAPAIGLSSANARVAVNQKAISGLFFLVGLAINAVFALFASSSVIYILLSAISYLIFIVIINTLQNLAN
jgi:hypothetical protein